MKINEMNAIKIGNLEIANITCTYEDEDRYGILIHDIRDVNGDGDGVLLDYSAADFDNEADLIAAMQNNEMITDGDILDTVRPE